MEQMQPIIAELVVERDASIFWYRGLGFEVDGEGLRGDGLQWVSMTREGACWLLRATSAGRCQRH